MSHNSFNLKEIPDLNSFTKININKIPASKKRKSWLIMNIFFKQENITHQHEKFNNLITSASSTENWGLWSNQKISNIMMGGNVSIARWYSPRGDKRVVWQEENTGKWIWSRKRRKHFTEMSDVIFYYQVFALTQQEKKKKELFIATPWQVFIQQQNKSVYGEMNLSGVRWKGNFLYFSSIIHVPIPSSSLIKVFKI